MPDLVIGDYVAGGYFLILPRLGPPVWTHSGFNVTRTISASEELVPALPCPTWADFERLAKKVGLTSEEEHQAGQRTDELFEAARFGFPNVFFNLQDAQGFYRAILPGRKDMTLIGVGLTTAHAEEFLDEVGLGPGISVLLARGEPISEGGTILGYDLLGMDVPPLGSWVMNDLPSLVYEQLGISVNTDGLIPTFDDACRAAELISRPDAPSPDWTWWPWLTVEYPL